MILIISKPLEQSTSDVTEWLQFLGKEYIRINFGDRIEIRDIYFKENMPVIVFSVNNSTLISTDIITSYWYRRGALSLKHMNKFLYTIKTKALQMQLSDNIASEINTVKELLYFVLESKNNTLGSFYTKENNKLIHLHMAGKLGIAVPETIICTDKEKLQQFYKKFPTGIIIKAAGNSFSFVRRQTRGNDKIFGVYTNQVTTEQITCFPKHFPPTLLQEKVEKEFELRIFYLKGQFYTMAIFSQGDEKTKMDFRRYNKEKQNYRVPFIIPGGLKRKLKKFMSEAGLSTGSIDMIYTRKKEFVFLEVNPVGQFGMVSYPCNYKLEKKIALALSN